MKALKCLKAWRRHRAAVELGRTLIGLGGAALCFAAMALAGAYIGGPSIESMDDALIYVAVVCLVWTLVYLLFFRRRYRRCFYDSAPIDYDEPIDRRYFYGCTSARGSRAGAAAFFVGPFCLEAAFGGFCKAASSLGTPVGHPGEVADYLLKNPGRIPLAEIGADEEAEFDKYIQPLIDLDVCLLLESEPVAICVCTPFKKFCFKYLTGKSCDGEDS